MKTWFTILLLFVFSGVFGQDDVKAIAVKLEHALVAKDTVLIKRLLHKDVTYGHSNGWIETKEDVIKDLYSGKLEYRSIESSGWQLVQSKSWANIRSTSKVQYLLDGKPGELHLHVLQVWYKTKGGWKLIARQSTKI